MKSRRSILPTSDARSRHASASIERLEGRTYFDGLAYAGPVHYPIGGRLGEEPAMADFNGDGIVDLAFANRQNGDATPGSTLSILLGQGGGVFAPPAMIDVGPQPLQTVAGDFDGDGQIDLAVVVTGDASVRILHGRGDGTFEPAAGDRIAHYAASGVDKYAYLAPADLNGDGRPDLVVSDTDAGAIFAILNDGEGGLQPVGDPVAILPSLRNSGAGLLADFDGNGTTDIVTIQGGSTELVMIAGRGDGTFEPARSAAPKIDGSLQLSSAFGDLNGDEKLDVAMVVLPPSDTGPSPLAVFLGNGDGTFQPGVSRGNGGVDARGVALADFNGDGKLDAIVHSNPKFAVLAGNGDGTFDATPLIRVDNPRAAAGLVSLANLNNDAVPDILVYHLGETYPSPFSLSVFLSKPVESGGGGDGGGGDGGDGGGDGGGGNGGGGGVTPTAALTPTVSVALPPGAVIAAGGQPARGARVTIGLTNNGTLGLTNAPVTVELFASTDATLDETDVAIGDPTVRRLSLAGGSTRSVRMPLPGFPMTPAGDYFILARASVPNATPGVGATASPFAVAAAANVGVAIPDSDSQVLAFGQRGSLTVALTHSSDDAKSDPKAVVMNFALRPTAGGADIPIAVMPFKVSPKRDGTRTVHLRFIVRPSLPAGTYLPVVTLCAGPGNVLVDRDASNNSAVGLTALEVG